MTGTAASAKASDPRWAEVHYWHAEHHHNKARALAAAIERDAAPAPLTSETL